MELVRPFARVPETLQKIRDSGIKLITMTNRIRASSIKTMEHSGILKYFDGLCCADDVLRTKPDPEHVFAALRPFEITPEDSFVVGDSPADIQSGRSAGARTIAVSHGLHADVESLEPDHVIHKIEDILPIVIK
jgi:HAD superfamily hydrolase (TIGR01509 family)